MAAADPVGEDQLLVGLAVEHVVAAKPVGAAGDDGVGIGVGDGGRTEAPVSASVA
jgi:hypothetical protein